MCRSVGNVREQFDASKDAYEEWKRNGLKFVLKILHWRFLHERCIVLHLRRLPSRLPSKILIRSVRLQLTGTYARTIRIGICSRLREQHKSMKLFVWTVYAFPFCLSCPRHNLPSSASAFSLPTPTEKTGESEIQFQANDYCCLRNEGFEKHRRTRLRADALQYSQYYWVNILPID